MDELIEGVGRFRAEAFPARRELYERLAREGQAPAVLVIACSDSRVAPEAITQAAPGAIFVVRNAGNLVPRFGEDGGEGVAAAVEYAVAALGVRHVVVCGHTDCGAMKAVLRPDLARAMPSVGRWLARCGCAAASVERARAAPEGEGARLVAEVNVAAQLEHLRTHPAVAAGLAVGRLALHGWLFDIARGTVDALDRRTGAFAPMTSACVDSKVAPRNAGGAPLLPAPTTA